MECPRVLCVYLLILVSPKLGCGIRGFNFSMQHEIPPELVQKRGECVGLVSTIGTHHMTQWGITAQQLVLPTLLQ